MYSNAVVQIISTIMGFNYDVLQFFSTFPIYI